MKLSGRRPGGAPYLHDPEPGQPVFNKGAGRFALRFLGYMLMGWVWTLLMGGPLHAFLVWAWPF